MPNTPRYFIRRLQLGVLAAFAILSGAPLFSAPIIHYIVSDFDATQVAAGTVPNPGTLADGVTGAFSQPVVTLSTDIPTKGVPYGLGNRSIDCAGTSGVNAPGTRQLTKAAIVANGGFTCETWFRWNGVMGAYSIIDYAGTEQIYLNNGVLTMGYNNLSYPTIASVTPNQWHYVAVVFKATSPVLGDGSVVGEFTFYYNSAQATSILANASINNFGDSLDRTIGVGMHPAAGFAGNYFKGLIYSPRVSLGALTPSRLLWKEAPAVRNVLVEGTASAARLKADFRSATGQAISYRVSRDLKTWHIPGRAGLPDVSQTVTAQPGVLRATLDAPFSAATRMFFRASDGLNRKTFCDFDGDGLTDWTIARSAGTAIEWVPSYRNGGTGATITLGVVATDFVIPADYDGDGISDFCVWTNAAAGKFTFIRSSDSQTVTIPLGTTNDDPAVVGDYDGDGIDDPAVFRAPASGAPDGPCSFRFVRSSSYPSIVVTEVPWGFGNSDNSFPYVGDFDGDGKNDYCYQTSAGGGNGVFHLLLSSNGAQETIPLERDSDFLIPGDYDGDGRTDLCVRRTVGTARHHFILERDGGGTGGTPIVHGITGDISAPGDYDGDGITDLAVWRSSNTPGASRFIVRLSSTGALEEFKAGFTQNYPVSGWQVH